MCCLKMSVEGVFEPLVSPTASGAAKARSHVEATSSVAANVAGREARPQF